MNEEEKDQRAHDQTSDTSQHVRQDPLPSSPSQLNLGALAQRLWFHSQPVVQPPGHLGWSSIVIYGQVLVHFYVQPLIGKI